MSAREDLPTGLDAVAAIAHEVGQAAAQLWLPLAVLAVLLGAVLVRAVVRHVDEADA